MLINSSIFLLSLCILYISGSKLNATASFFYYANYRTTPARNEMLHRASDLGSCENDNENSDS